MASFWKTKACGQTVLPDKSVLIGQKLAESAKLQMRHFESFSNNVRLALYVRLPCKMKIVTCTVVVPSIQPWNAALPDSVDNF